MFNALVPIAVPFQEFYFTLMDGKFATSFFDKILTEEFINQPSSWGPGYTCCEAAAEWDSSRPSCHLVPLVSTHEDSRQMDKSEGFKESGLEAIDMIDDNPWAKPSLEWKKLVGGNTLKVIESKCRERFGLTVGQKNFDLEACSNATKLDSGSLFLAKRLQNMPPRWLMQLIGRQGSPGLSNN